MTILLVVALGICMAGCGGKAQSENEGTAQAQTESEGYARGKYLDLQNFSASASINAYPCYFSKPYLTPSQVAGMEDY